MFDPQLLLLERRQEDSVWNHAHAIRALYAFQKRRTALPGDYGDVEEAALKQAVRDARAELMDAKDMLDSYLQHGRLLNPEQPSDTSSDSEDVDTVVEAALADHLSVANRPKAWITYLVFALLLLAIVVVLASIVVAAQAS